VLDSVKDDATTLKARLGTTDKRKIEEFSTGLRELEVRIASEQPTSCQPAARPGGAPDIRVKTTQMLDLIAFAFQCDLTRVATFMLQNAGSGYVYDFLGITDGHHELSHHSGDGAKLAALQKIDTWEVEQFAYLLRKLKAIPEAGGTVLDNSLAFFSSEIEDGDSHSHFNMPILVGGKAGGNFTPGRHLRYANAPSVGNLFHSMLLATGVPSTGFGDSTGPLDQVKV
ncbi:MAG: Tat pathway signal sequence protein, partial [Myxococcaceae bacterium]|nr:Tat pathway signal sequence protein [Myxococcaceae bacterium]